MRHATTACNFSSLIWPDGSAPAAFASLLFDPRSHKSLELDDGWPESVEEHVLSSIKDIAGESFIEDDADDQQKGDRNAMSDLSRQR